MHGNRLAGMKRRERMFALLVERGASLRVIPPLDVVPAPPPILF